MVIGASDGNKVMPLPVLEVVKAISAAKHGNSDSDKKSFGMVSSEGMGTVIDVVLILEMTNVHSVLVVGILVS